MRPGCVRTKQGGAALLLLLLSLVLALSVAGWRYFNGDMLRNQKMERTTQALATAKAALLARATTREDTPGGLPCPDTNDDGSAELWASGSECPSYIGRFPYRTLEMDDLRDGDGERLWYAMSRNFRYAPNPVNASTNSDITLNGDTSVIAIVFSAGPPITGQTARRSDSASDYLEGSNATIGSTAFVAGTITDSFNDIALAIRKDEWLNHVARRILGLARGPDAQVAGAWGNPATGVRGYHKANSQFPDPPLTTSGTTFDAALTDNNWVADLTYTKISADAATLSLGSTSISVTPCIATPCP